MNMERFSTTFRSLNVSLKEGSRLVLKLMPVCTLGLALGLALPTLGQQSSENMPGYPVGNAPQSPPQDNNNQGSYPGTANPQQTPPGNPNYGGPAGAPPQGNLPQANMPAPQPVPASLTLPAGTVIQIRTNEWLSTDRNHVGDGFNATLAQPIVVDGWVVARRGQAVLGRLTVVEKARSSNHNTSQLGMQLSEVTFVDGQLLPVESQLSESGPGPDRGQQVGTVATTTGAGAIIGAIAGRGPGAAIGAGIGAIAGLGIVTNTGRPTVIPPESLLTFRLDSAVTISTGRSSLAFRPVNSIDYAGAVNSNRPRLRQDGAYPPPPPPSYYGYPYAYSPYYYPGGGYYPPVVLGFGYGYGYGWGYPRYGRYYGRFR
jgi:hypothetical protein